MSAPKQFKRNLSIGVSDNLADTLQHIATIKGTTIAAIAREMIALGLETYLRRSQSEMAPMDHAYTTLSEKQTKSEDEK